MVISHTYAHHKGTAPFSHLPVQSAAKTSIMRLFIWDDKASDNTEIHLIHPSLFDANEKEIKRQFIRNTVLDFGTNAHILGYQGLISENNETYLQRRGDEDNRNIEMQKAALVHSNVATC